MAFPAVRLVFTRVDAPGSPAAVASSLFRFRATPPPCQPDSHASSSASSSSHGCASSGAATLRRSSESSAPGACGAAPAPSIPPAERRPPPPPRSAGSSRLPLSNVGTQPGVEHPATRLATPRPPVSWCRGAGTERRHGLLAAGVSRLDATTGQGWRPPRGALCALITCGGSAQMTRARARAQGRRQAMSVRARSPL